jgi:hypothetical protein
MSYSTNFFGNANSQFVTFDGKGGRTTRHDVLRQKELADAHKQADRSEREQREIWKLHQTKGLDFGLDCSWLDRTFEHKNEQYRVIGARVKSEDELWIMCRVINGDRFIRVTADFIRQKMAKK